MKESLTSLWTTLLVDGRTCCSVTHAHQLSRKFREYTGNDCSIPASRIFLANPGTSEQVSRFIGAKTSTYICSSALAACPRLERATILLARGVNSCGLRRRGSARLLARGARRTYASKLFLLHGKFIFVPSLFFLLVM